MEEEREGDAKGQNQRNGSATGSVKDHRRLEPTNLQLLGRSDGVILVQVDLTERRPLLRMVRIPRPDDSEALLAWEDMLPTIALNQRQSPCCRSPSAVLNGNVKGWRSATDP